MIFVLFCGPCLKGPEKSCGSDAHTGHIRAGKAKGPEG